MGSFDRCAIVIDVREQYEWDAGHVSCATRIQIQKNPTNWRQDVLALAGGNKETPIVTYCAAGVRAQSAVDMLVQEGYTDAVNGGGYSTQLESICQACFSTSRESTSSFDLAASSSFADDLTSTSTVPLMTSGAAELFTSFPTVLLLSLFCLRCIRGFH
ncbi:unnamed protein product [Durusdinium trenchii]|uniref:Rhodanese domain-containing protein n=1 Tax=Durusdinium trenchii TaxID=1381693 RepID=A0ABP0PWB1_9DINO